MRVAVTGASGHIGSALLPKLLEAGHHVKCLSYRSAHIPKHPRLEIIPGSLQDIPHLRQLAEGVDTLFHLAAFITIYKGEEQRVWSTNVDGTANVVNACLEQKVRRLIHFSSIHACCQFPHDQPLNEERALVGKDAAIYDYSKATAEKIVLAAGEKGQLETVVLSPTGCIGPEDHKPSLMGQMLLSLAQGRLPALVKGGFDWVDVRDVASAALAALEADCAGQKFLLPGRWATVDDLARLVEQFTGRGRPRLVLPVWLALAGLPFVSLGAALLKSPPLYTRESLRTLQTGHPNIRADKAGRLLRFSARPLEDTIRDTLQWLQA